MTNRVAIHDMHDERTNEPRNTKGTKKSPARHVARGPNKKKKTARREIAPEVDDVKKENRPGTFKPGNQVAKNKGRPLGVPNKLSAILKDAILLAAGEVGSDGRGAGGIIGYLKRVARQEPKSFVTLLGRVLPYTVTMKLPEGEVPVRTREEVLAELQRRGLPIAQIYATTPEMLAAQEYKDVTPAPEIEGTATEVKAA